MSKLATISGTTNIDFDELMCASLLFACHMPLDEYLIVTNIGELFQ